MINKINKYSFVYSIAICAALLSCTNDNELSHEVETIDPSELSCEAQHKVVADDMTSRSALSLGKSGMLFTWTNDDEITVFAKDDNRARQIYSIVSGGNTPSAHFYADNFSLKEAQLYYAFSKSERNPHVSTPDQNNILIDYSGQTQKGNNDTKHLGDYDFMAAGTQCVSANSASFDFSHLGATVRVTMNFSNLMSASVVTVDEKNAFNFNAETHGTELKMMRFTEMEIYDSENSFRQPNRYFSFKAGTSTDGKSYTFKWPEQEITSMDRFTLALKSQDGTDGITSKEIIDQENSLITFMEVPPADFTNKTIGIMVKGYYEKYEYVNGEYKWVKHPVSYVQTYNSGWTFGGGAPTYEIVAGKAYPINNLSMEKPLDFKVTLKLNHKWQHGSTLDNSSRGTGDPGYDKEYGLPAHVYYILCVGGQVKTVKHLGTGSANAVNDFTTSTTEGEDWVTTPDKTISSYKTNQLVFTVANADADKPKHLYVVASASTLTITAEENEAETSVQEKLYNLPADNVQLFMRDLYSTPWDDHNFVGNITDPVQDVILYHVAAKVDLKWNWDGTNLIDNVKVNNVKKENLYLFKPTENIVPESPYTGYTASKDIPTELQKNGRYVFYLPQFVKDNCKYNVKLGSHDPVDVKFNPYDISTLGGFTSWLRWLKQEQ